MLIKELLENIEKFDTSNKLPRYITASDLSSSQVKIEDEWRNVIFSWGILHKDNKYIYFETDSEKGYISFVKQFEDEQSASDYAYNTLIIEQNAVIESTPLDMAVRYIEQKYGYLNIRAEKTARQIMRHEEICDEFSNYMHTGKMRKKDRTQVVICGYTAEKLFTEYDLSPLGAYNYLVYLNEEPERALADLKNGLPKR